MAKNRKTNKTPIKKFVDKFGIDKSKLITSLLVGFAVPFMLLVCAVLSVYFANAKELPFTAGTFVPMMIGAFAIVFVVITAALLLTKGKVRNIIFTLLSALVVCAYIQSMITNLTFGGLPGDGNTEATPVVAIIFNFLMWVVLFAVAIWFCVLSDKTEVGRKVLCFLLVLVMVMQVVSIVPAAITSATGDEDEPEVVGKPSYLTTANMFELSKKDNVIVFILDRFDVRYYNEIMGYDSSIFDEFDGFTYYSDNISKFPRTYPAITTMLTGVNNDYSTSREIYFKKAYGNSTFLKDMKDNNYKINLYIPSYYGYEDASVFGDTVANISTSDGYTISSWGEFGSTLFELGAYFWAPEVFKSNDIASSSFADIVSLNGEAPQYEMDKTTDAAIYDRFATEGLSTQSKENTFTFLHLRGCHSPFTMDENCNPMEESNSASLRQTRGCFKFISEYIAQMKELGIYEDATIIITGDHAALNSDRQEYTDENLTALLVKEKGSYGTPMKTSTAQVSQDNFIPTIVKSTGIKTAKDYGKAYSEIPEGAQQTRIHYYQNLVGSGSNRNDVNITYEITGNGNDFSNWKVTEREEIGYIYK